MEDGGPPTPVRAPSRALDEEVGHDGHHEFVQRAICSHPVWSNPQYWEEAFYRSVREEVRKLYPEDDSSRSAAAPLDVCPCVLCVLCVVFGVCCDC